MKRYNDAQNALAKAEKIGTNSPWLQVNWGALLIEQEQYEEALKRYRHIVETGTTNKKAYSSALSGVTTAYRQMKQYDKANDGIQKRDRLCT